MRKEEIAFLQNVHKQDLGYLNEIQNENTRLQRELDELEQQFREYKLKIEQQRTMIDQEKQRQAGLKSQVEVQSHKA